MSADLKPFALFSELASEERDQLQDFLEERQVGKGRRLFEQGDEAEALLLLAEGRLRLLRDRQEVAELGAGTSLGGACLARIGRRACTAEALEDISLFALTRESYLRLRADFPLIALAIQEALMRSMANDVEELLQS